MKRALVVAVTVPAAVILGVLIAAPPASAHPLGNFSVNRYAALTLNPSLADALVVADIAELPTLQDPAPTCAEAAEAFTVAVDGTPLSWSVASSSAVRAPGAGGLATTRLECRLTAPASLRSPSKVEVANVFRDDRIGWRELVAAAGPGVRLSGSPLPAAGISDELRRYPDDLLSSPPDVRSATFMAAPDQGWPAAGGADPGGAAGGGTAGLSSGATPFGGSGPLAGAERWLTDTAGGREITPLIGVLAVLLALLLGAGHAALPGHGKTVMAMYMAGRRGRPRDAMAVGATVTLTHTGGVLAVGLLLTTAAGIAGESVLGYLGLASGLLVTAIGASALVTTRRRRATLNHHHHHGSGAHPPGHDHVHGPRHDHVHDHRHDHTDGRRGDGGRPGRWSIAGMGIAGGLVPSPSALIVLLGAAALGRTVFGVLLVLAYGLGMAATLTAAGLLLIKVRDRLEGRFPIFDRLRAVLPRITAALIVLVGAGLAGRALLTLI